MKKTTLLAFTAIMIGTSAFAKTYFAAPGATGNGITVATPGDFTKLAAALKPGDILNVKGGQYNFTEEIKLTASGTEAQLVTIQAASGETPIFDFRKEEYNKNGVNIAASVQYLHLKGITIRYAGGDGLYNEGGRCVLENLNVYGNCGSGVVQKGTVGYNYILNCDSHDNFDYRIGGINSAKYGEASNGFTDEEYSAPGNYYQGCRAWNNASNGWAFSKRQTTEGGNVIDGCIAFRNGLSIYDMRGHARYEVDKAWFDQFAGKGITVTIAGGDTETLSLEQYTSFGHSNGISLGGNETVNNILVMRSVMVANKNKALNQLYNAGTMFIYNNSMYQNGYNVGISDRENGRAFIYNNVSLKGHSKDQLACKETTLKNNSWEISGVICNENSFVSLDTTLLLKPRQADGSLTKSSFMRLKDDSGLLDQGTKDIYGSYLGEAPEAGYCEIEKGQSNVATDTLVTSVIGKVLDVVNALKPKPTAEQAKGKAPVARRPVARKK